MAQYEVSQALSFIDPRLIDGRRRSEGNIPGRRQVQMTIHRGRASRQLLFAYQQVIMKKHISVGATETDAIYQRIRPIYSNVFPDSSGCSRVGRWVA